MRLNDDEAVSKAIAMHALDHLRHADASPAKGNATPPHGAKSAGWRSFPAAKRRTRGEDVAATSASAASGFARTSSPTEPSIGQHADTLSAMSTPKQARHRQR